MKILVVDDDQAVRESLAKVLSHEGYEVILAADGAEALKRFSPKQVDLVLLDIGLPIKCGWDAFERMTKTNPALPIIITGQADQFDAAVAAGVGAFVEKPVDVPELLKMMRELLAEPREARLKRLCGYRQDVRHVPPNSRVLLEQLRQRHETPFRYRRLTVRGSY